MILKKFLFLLFFLCGCVLPMQAQDKDNHKTTSEEEANLYENFNHEGDEKIIRLIRLKSNLIAFLKGVIGGIVLAMLLGPVFFALIRTSLDKGFKSGAFLAFGVATSDALVASVIFSGLSQFTGNNDFRTYLGLIGGGLMIAFGVLPFIKPAEKAEFHPQSFNNNGYSRKFFEGVLLNLLNPFVYIFWIGIIGSVSLESSNTDIQIMFFLAGIVLTVLMTDLLKVYIANRITNFLTAQIITKIDKVAGVGLFAFGIRLLYFAYWGK